MNNPRRSTAMQVDMYAHLPSDWQVQTIRDVVDPTRRVTYGIVQPGGWQASGIPMIRGQDYSSGTVDDSNLYLVRPGIAASYQRSVVQGGDILFSIVGYLGQVAMVPDHLAGANITQTTARIAIVPPNNNRFFFYQFQADLYQPEVRKYQKGSAQPGLNLADVERMRVVVPPLPEQRRIAEILDAADDAIRQTERVIAKLRQVKAGLLHDLLTRGLDTQGRLRDPDAHPEQFPSGPISEIAEINPTINIKNLEADTEVSFIPMVDVSNDGEWTNHQNRRLWEVKNGYTAFQEGDILFAKITPCTENGKGAHVIGLTQGVGFGSTEFHVLRAKTPNNARFIYHWCQSNTLRQKAASLMTGSAGQQRVPSSFFFEFSIVLFSSEMQSYIAAVLDAADARIRAEEATLAKLRQVKRGLMDDLLTGRVRV